MTVESREIADYYDDFALRRHVQGFCKPDIRHFSVIRLCKRVVRPRERVLELGCGVGILTKALVRNGCSVDAYDISPMNIAIARLYCTSSGASFVCADIRDELPANGRKYDVVVMSDVLEHIPIDDHAPLWERVRSLLADGARVVLTFPSPEYQKQLRAFRPDELQIVDETITLPHLLETSGLHLTYFEYKNIWRRHDYIHAVLEERMACPRAYYRRTFAARVRYRLFWAYWRLIHARLVRRVRHIRLEGVSAAEHEVGEQ